MTPDQARAGWLLVLGMLLLTALAVWAVDQPYAPTWAPAWHAAQEDGHREGGQTP